MRHNKLKPPPDIISWPAGSTYDLITECCIHAHPVNDYFRIKYDCPYLTFRKTGGFMERIYSVQKTLICDPARLAEHKDELTEDEYERLNKYVSLRNGSGFGFSNSGPYRFYFLQPAFEITEPFCRPGCQSHLYYNLEDIPHYVELTKP